MNSRYRYIMIGFATLLFMGVGLAWSIFVVPVETLFGWTRAQTSLVFTINILCFSVGSILAGVLSKHFKYQHILKLAAILIALGFILSGSVKEVWQLYLTYGVIAGSGIGMGYNCIISSCPIWMPEKSATATGLLLMGYALSTAIFGPVLNTLINSVGIVNTFRILGALCGSCIFFFSFFIRIPTLEEASQLPQAPKKSTSKESIITSDMIKMPVFWVYLVISMIFAGVGLVITNHNAPILTEDLLMSASSASLIISIVSITNGVARFCWGMLFDKLGVQKCITMIGIFSILTIGGVYLGYQTKSLVLYIISACLVMVVYGGNATTSPAIIRSLFGNRTFSLNFSVASLNAIPASFIPTIIGSLQTINNSYSLPFILLLGVCVLNFGLVMIFNKQVKKM